MKTLTIKLKVEDSTYAKMIDFFHKADQAYLEDIISNNLTADLESGDLSILDITKPGLPDDDVNTNWNGVIK